MIHLTAAAARAFMVTVQRLDRLPAGPASKADVLEAIRRMGALQIDTIHVVARSPYFVLWSRLGAFEPRWLEELLAERALFEYWSHEACFLPIEDFPLYRRLMIDSRKGWSSSQEWLGSHATAVADLLTHIRDNGPVRSADFERKDGKKGGWWEWKHEKLMLEHLHNVGTLMTARRQRFQRVYDLRERLLPDWDDARTPSYEEVAHALAVKGARALGLTTSRWLADYFRTPKTEATAVASRLEAAGELEPVTVEGWSAPAWIHRDHRALAEEAAAGRLEPTLTTLLSPFDPLVWDRARTKAVFGMEYRIECYTPAPKRVYGYFTLPILHRGALIGRLDPKAHRAEGRFEVKALHLEPEVEPTEEIEAGLGEALRRCADWHGTPEVEVSWANRPGLAKRVTRAARAGR